MAKTAEDLAGEIGIISAQIQGITKATIVQIQLTPPEGKEKAYAFGFIKPCEEEVRAATLRILNKYRAALVMQLAQASGMLEGEEPEGAPLLALPAGAVPPVGEMGSLEVEAQEGGIVEIEIHPPTSMIKTTAPPPIVADKKGSGLMQGDAQQTYTRRDEPAS